MSNPNRDTSAEQLSDYGRDHENNNEKITTSWGAPIPDKDASLTVGHHGPILLQDYNLIDELAHFTRERIPERVVHAKGAGAFGYFEVTHDITKYTAAKVFSDVGKKTPIAVRFSQVAGELGYPDTIRDIRGFAIKFYTEDGIWDLTGNNTPVFFVKDCALFPSFIHTMKRNPKTHMRPDYDMFWDMVTLRPETTHTCLMFFSDRGLPANFRRMHGFGVNTYAFVNSKGEFYYCKFHYRSEQENMDPATARKLAGEDPDYHLRDLYNAIEEGRHPSWRFYVQIMTPKQAEKSPYDPFDDTKVWLHADYPLIPVGRFVLNKNPGNYFAEVEQIGFDPAHLVPGIEPSPDRMLQGRLFAYGDTHRYRLGVNHLQIPVNSPLKAANFARDGRSTLHSQGEAPNYHPNSFNGPGIDKRAKALSPVIPLHGEAARTDNGNDDNFTQARLLYNDVMKSDERARLIDNMLDWLKPTKQEFRNRAIEMFAQVDAELGKKLKLGLNSSRHIDL
ncbi:unnamed protein product [Phyllotreta striolata]|uniref:Catalase n=1 Tax=Phyllotreta striolata TaxID=444603 RepID=A0A9N9XW21_PHYSR|nr:unnamed protein product [Phyllotreta striolata]